MNLLRLRKSVRRYVARAPLQELFRLLYRASLMGMNYGGAGSSLSSGDAVALERVRAMRDLALPCVVLDVGANIGSYVGLALKTLGAGAHVYAFEPSAAAFAKLHKAYGSHPCVHLMQAGVSATSGTATLWSDAPGSVLASTYAQTLNGDVHGEPISLVTIDDFCERHGIDRVSLLKLDVEGSELDALRGARRLLERRAIQFIQFEFGQPSIGSRTFFADLFELLSPGYEIYRVLPAALQRIPQYHETLEVFMSTNYLAISRLA